MAMCRYVAGVATSYLLSLVSYQVDKGLQCMLEEAFLA